MTRGKIKQSLLLPDITSGYDYHVLTQAPYVTSKPCACKQTILIKLTGSSTQIRNINEKRACFGKKGSMELGGGESALEVCK